MRLNAARKPSNATDEKHGAWRVLETSQGTEILARARRRVSAAKWMRSTLILGYHAAYIGGYLPTFRDMLSVQSSSVKQFKKTNSQKKKIFLDSWTLQEGTNSLSRSVGKYHCTLRNIPDGQRCLINLGGILKLRILNMLRRSEV